MASTTRPVQPIARGSAATAASTRRQKHLDAPATVPKTVLATEIGGQRTTRSSKSGSLKAISPV